MAFYSRSPVPKDVQEEIGNLSAEYHSLVEDASPRLGRYANTRNEFNAPRDVDINGVVADVTDYGHRRSVQEPNRHNIPIPLHTALTIKHAHRLFGDLPDVIVDRRQETKLERYRSDTIEKMVWAMIRASGDKAPFKDAAWDGSQLGACVLDLYFDHVKQIPTFCRVDPAEVLIVPGGRDPHNFHRVYRSWTVSVSTLIAEYEGKEFRGVPVREILSGFSNAKVTLVQMTSRDRTIRFVIDGLPTSKDAKKVPIFERDHNLGFVNYIVIPNIGPYNDIWGWGDYELVRGLVHYIPTLFSREADIIRAVAGGAYQEDGTGQSASNIMGVIRKGGVLPTKRGSSVKPIEPPSVPDFAPLHSDRALEFLKMVGFAPDASWGDGSAGSGSDRGLQLAPMLELTAMKQSNWSQGLQRLFGMGLQMLEKQVGPGDSNYYSGQTQKRGARKPFVFGPFGSDVPPQTVNAETMEPVAPQVAGMAESEQIDTLDLPRNPKELFQGDYTVRTEWNNRIDPDDPAYVASELNKFAQGLQSMRTTLEHLGHQNPEDEMKLIADEAEAYPWVRDGVLKMLQMQFDAEQQGEGGGNMTQNPGVGGAASSMASSDTAATDADVMTRALRGGVGTPYGSA